MGILNVPYLIQGEAVNGGGGLRVIMHHVSTIETPSHSKNRNRRKSR